MGTIMDADNKIKTYDISKNFYFKIETSILFRNYD